jgi:hypothetical protein
MHMFCYSPQKMAIIELLREMGFMSPQLHAINDAETIRGLEGCTFVRIRNHMIQPPQDLLNNVRIYGFMTVELNDQFMRERLGRGAYR